MLHPHTELRFVNPKIGYGVFATELIVKGTITWARDDLDRAYSPQEMNQMTKPYRQVLDKYTFIDSKGLYVLCWDLAKYINHSCEANCLSAGYEFEIATKDIQAGEELTDDYGTLNLETGFECHCNLQSCRRQILFDDLLRYSVKWDRILREAFPLILEVFQPLWSFVKEKDDVILAAQNSAHMKSSRANLRPPQRNSSILMPMANADPGSPRAALSV